MRRATWRVALGLSALLGCRESTHVVLDLTTDVPCADLRATTIAVGTAGEVESAPATTSTDRCEGRVIGDLVLVPSDSTEEKFAVRVVAGVKVSPEDCVANGYQGGCIVGRRLLRFVPHTELRLPVALTLDCLDVPCSETETCVGGNCVSAEIPDSTLCAESGGCVLGGGAAGAGAAGAGAAGGAGVGGAAGAGGAPGGGGPGASGGGGSGSGGEPASGGAGGMLVCDPPTTGDCNSSANDGCETELTTSPAHCGACGHDCLGGECELGVCQAFALVPGNTDQPSFVGADEQHVYWGHWASGGALRRLPLSGGGGVSDFALDQSFVRAIVLDATHVYWTTALASGAVMKRPKDLSVAATSIVQVNTPRELAVDGSRVFYTAGSGNTGLVASALLGGGGGTTLAANNFPWGIAVDATNVYFDANFNMGDVLQVAKGGAAAPAVLGTGKFPYSMAVDATHVYFVDTLGVFKLSLGAGVLEKLADAVGARSMTIDDTHVYWTESVASGSVRKVAKTGPPLTTLATGQASPRGIAVNEKAVFWGNDVQGGAVMMVAK